MIRTLISLSICTSMAMAAVPHVFKSGDPAKAADVNDNFAAVDTVKLDKKEFFDSITSIKTVGTLPPTQRWLTDATHGFYMGFDDNSLFGIGIYSKSRVSSGLKPSMTISNGLATFPFQTLHKGSILVQDPTISLPTDILASGYQLPNLDSLSTYIKSNSNLPGIQSSSDAATNGIDLVNLNVQLLRKVEELTLIVIQQNNRIKALEAK